MTTPTLELKADAAAVALGSAWDLWSTAGGRGWFSRKNGLFAAVTGVAYPGFNGVWTEQRDFDEQTLGELLDRVADVGVPFCLQARPSSAARVAPIAESRGMTADHQVPLMVLHDASRLSTAEFVEGLTIRRLKPDEIALHNDIASRGFGAPLELLEQLGTPEVVGMKGSRFYVGEAGGIPVTTGTGVTVGEAVGIFNIATPEEHRGRGYGAAVTARAVLDGLAAGAEWSYLQSSEAGYRIYQALGFEAVEVWDSWVKLLA